VDRRLLPDEKKEEVLSEIKEAIGSVQARNPLFKYQIEEIDDAEPSEIDPNEEIVWIGLEAGKEVRGEKPNVRGFSGFTDGRFYVNQFHIPTLIFGPGGTDQSHTTDESVEVEALIKAAHIYALKEAELIPLLTDVDGLIAGLDEFSGKAMKSANRLKVISRYGVGLDNVDLEAARGLGIEVKNTPDANTQAVADLTFGLILAVSRMIPQSHQSTREGKWGRFFGLGVYGKSLGIIGLGRIGKAVARRAKGF